ncbi:MAG: UpxY family transcription antiterminator [Tannerella sp.]|nr:UpxY family transcription antiterminator [Tannerella sp.]
MATVSWYALYTTPRAEKKVNERLQMMGVECYLPLHKSPRVWNDRVQVVDIPLFTSYIFVRCSEPELRNLLHVDGIVRIVFFCAKPAIIRQKEIEAIRQFLEQAANRELCVGEEVEILSGALKKVSGKIQKIKKHYLYLTIEQIGLTVCVKIANVAPVKRIK